MALLPARMVAGNGQRINEPVLSHHQLVRVYCAPDDSVRHGLWSRFVLFVGNRGYRVIPHQGMSQSLSMGNMLRR